jgi:hypothetical protein
MISSTDNQTAAGSLTIVIDQVYGYTNSTTVDVLDVGDIKFDFDIADSETDATSIYSRIGDCTMKIRNILGNGDDFYDEIKQTSTNPFRIKFTLNANSGSSYDFYFYAYKNDVKITEMDRSCHIKLRPIYYGGKSGQNYFDGTIDGLDPVGDGYTSNAYISNEENTLVVSSGRFIRDALKSFSGVDSLILISDAHEDTNTYTNGVAYNLVGDPFPPSGDNAVVAVSSASMLDVVLNFAAEEGAIFGSSFNQNFYVKRVSTNNKVTITYADIEDLSSEQSEYKYRTISVTSSGGLAYDSSQLSDTTTVNYNLLSQKTFSFNSAVTLGLYGEWRTNVQPNPPLGSYYNNVFFLGSDGQGTKVDTIDSVSGYAAALGADMSDRIELTVFGFDKILPWTPFEISSSTSSFLPDGISDRHSGIVFRPTSLVYSFKEDKVKIKAYKIA